MSVRRSRVRAVPDFEKVHQQFESQLEARKREMKCTKIEEFNFAKSMGRSDHLVETARSSQHFVGTPRSNERPTMIHVAHHDQARFTETTSWEEDKMAGCSIKVSGILKNGGRTEDAMTENQLSCSGAVRVKRLRVTFDVASPAGRSPASLPRRVPVGYGAASCSSALYEMGSPKHPASKTSMTCRRVPGDGRMGSSTRAPVDRQQPQRIPSHGMGSEAAAARSREPTSPGCSRFLLGQGFSRFQEEEEDSVVMAIDFNDENEEDGKLEGVGILKNPLQSLRADAIHRPNDSIRNCAWTNSRRGMKDTPIRKLHYDNAPDLIGDGTFSPLLRTNSNCSAEVRSPLSAKTSQKDWKRGSTRIPQPKMFRGGSKVKATTGKENSSQKILIKELNKRRRSEDSVIEEEERRNESQVNPRCAAKSQGSEEMDAFDVNKTINKMERKVQRLKRRSQMTEEKSELDGIMKKLEVLEKKMEALRIGLRSIRQNNTNNAPSAAEILEPSSRWHQPPTESEPLEQMEKVEQPVEESVIQEFKSSAVDCSEWKENVDPLVGQSSGSAPSSVGLQPFYRLNPKSDLISLSSRLTSSGETETMCVPAGERFVLADITAGFQSGSGGLEEDDENMIILEEESDSDSTDDLGSGQPEEVFVSEPEGLSTCGGGVETHLEFCTSSSPNVSSEFVEYETYRWKEGVDGMSRLFNPVAASLTDTDERLFEPISSPLPSARSSDSDERLEGVCG